MQVAARSYLAAGAALVGAGAMAISPVAPPLPDIQVPAISSAAVELNAFENPIEVWAQVIGTSFANLGALGDEFLSNPAPILQQIAENQLANLAVIGAGLQTTGETIGQLLPEIPKQFELALTQLQNGEIASAFQTLSLIPVFAALPALGLVTPVLEIAQNTTQNFANVVATLPNVILPLGLGLLAPVIGPFQELGVQLEAVVKAVEAGDYETAVSTVINMPARLTDKFLNGEFGSGLLSPGGTIEGLLNVRETLANALKPIATDVFGLRAEAAAPDAAADTTALDPGAAKVAAGGTTVTLNVSADTVGAPAQKRADVTPPTELSAAEPAAVDTSVTTDEKASATAETGAGTEPALVRDSIKAEPGKTDTSVKSGRTNPLKQVRNDIRNTVTNVTDGLRKAAEGLSGKTKSAKSNNETSSSSTGSGESGSSASSGAASGSSSDAA